MSTEAARQVLDDSVDATGISIVTANRTVAEPRRGTLYNPTGLAAAEPVWFHPLQDGRWIALLSEVWSDATVSSTGGPQTYSEYTTSTTPHWVTFDPVHGAPGAVTEIPTGLSGTRDLAGACSRVDFIFTVGTLDGAALIQHHRIAPNGELILQGEEIAPNPDDILFGYGCYIDAREVVVFGANEDGHVYRARKSWGRIGIKTDVNEQWQYQGLKGWTTDPDDLEPLRDTSGAEIVTTGPVSYGKIGDREYISVMTSTTAKFYSSRMVDRYWVSEASPLIADFLYLQPQLRPQSVPDGARNAIPYVITEYDDTEEENSLQVSWGLLAV